MALSPELAIKSIHTMHILIEKIFTGKNDQQDFQHLNDHFSDDFEMVGAAGKRFKFDEVKQLFANNQAKMPDIQIEIFDEEILSQSENTIVLTYTEKHTKTTGVLIRRSCALIEEQNGKILWRYLQETFLT